MQQTVKTTYLEMTSPDQLVSKSASNTDIIISEAKIPSPDLNHFLFMAVGQPWQWYSRLSWRREDWQQYLNSSAVQTWVGYMSGTPFGYFELEEQANTGVEIKFFGLMQQYIGRGLGAILLSRAIAQAWAMGTSRVWLHTCSLDHPKALPNYQKRGFKIYDVETAVEEIPDADDTIWLSPNFYLKE